MKDYRDIWTYATMLLGSGISNTNFGYSIALNNNGTEMMVGEPSSDFYADGMVNYLTKSKRDGSWSMQQRLNGVQLNRFGSSVAVCGNVVYIGSSTDTISSSMAGN